jgi:uroporphyrinogen decarboxylase
MTSLSRVMAAVRFEETDQVPVIAQVFGHAATLAGVPVDEYVQDGPTIARCQLAALEHYGYDAVFSVMDASVETEAAGSVLRYRPNQYPVVERYAFSREGEWTAAGVPDPRSDGRMPSMLEALGIMREELKNDVLVVGCVLGPLTLASQLIGLEAALYLALDDPSLFEHLLDFSTELAIRFGRAQIEAGAHLPMVFDPSASPAVVPPQFFREFELPRLRLLFQALAEAGSVANWLHIAGPARGILPFYPTAGAHIANIDYYLSGPEMSDLLPGTCISGNLKSLTFVEGSPADIAAESQKLLGVFRDRGGFILSSGCEIPPEARADNVAALVGAVRAG